MVATGFIVGLLVAFFGAAVGALLGQFLTYYRRKKENIERLISLLEWLNRLEPIEVSEGVAYSDSFVWKLWDSLFTSYETNYPILNDSAKFHLQEILSSFSILRDHSPEPTGEDEITTPNEMVVKGSTSTINEHAENALDEIGQIGIRKCEIIFLPWGNR